jgi:hypothetical protein
MPSRKRPAEETEWERVHLQNYTSSVRGYRRWFDAADELQFAAELLKPQVRAWWSGVVEWRDSKERPRKFPALGCHSIMMMLFSFAIENLCKGALIRDGQVDVSSGAIINSGLPKELKSHNVRSLIRAVGLTCDDADQELLSRMSRAATWRGRYPAAAKYADAIHTLRLDNGKEYSAAWFGESDIDRIESLVGRVRSHLGAERSFTVARDAGP